MAAASLAILQLDTRFPRLPGDIACPDTYARPVRIQTITNANVNAVVSPDPDQFNLSLFEHAVCTAKESVITTSCGFMIYFQDYLDNRTEQTFVSSALTALPSLRTRYADDEILILTFDADTLASPAYASSLDGFSGPIVGINKSGHLYTTIKQDCSQMDAELVRAELAELADQILACQPQIKAILLECTNISPYKVVFRSIFEGEIIDSLSVLERLSPGLVKTEFLI